MLNSMPTIYIKILIIITRDYNKRNKSLYIIIIIEIQNAHYKNTKFKE